MSGLINLTHRHKHAQFYTTIGERTAWGKGYAKEIIELVLNFAFKEIGLQKVYLLTMHNNEKARKIYEKTEFKQEALKKRHYFVRGEYFDIYQHAILKEESQELYS